MGQDAGALDRLVLVTRLAQPPGRNALRLLSQRAQIIPERMERRVNLAVSRGQRAKRGKLQLKTGPANRPCQAVDGVVGLKSDVIMHRSFAHRPHQRHEERDWGSMCRRLHAYIVRCSICPCHLKTMMSGQTGEPTIAVDIALGRVTLP